jgi:ATP-dependent Clp endopeptidase proteolytic subunit ClpP
MKTTWAFQIRAEADAVDLDVYDVVGDYWGDGPTAKGVLDKLAAAKGAKQINVRINSVGGVVDDGLAIYNLLNAHPAKKTVYVDGLAASIASVLAMAGDEIVMPESAMMMIHLPWGLEIGGADQMRVMADMLDKRGGQLAGIYAARTGQKLDDVVAAMKAETWMTADEAMALGYATSVVPSKKMAARAGMSLDVSKFNRTPAAAFAMATAFRPAPSPKQADVTDQAGKTTAPIVDAVSEPAPTPAASPAAQKGKTPMNKDELKAQHPELYATVLAEGKAEGEKDGVAKERKRVNAHIKLGTSSGDMKLAHDSIASGANPQDDEIFAAYQSAAMTRRDTANRVADDKAAGAALDNADKPAPNAGGTGDAVDQGVERFLAGRGKKAANG